MRGLFVIGALSANVLVALAQTDLDPNCIPGCMTTTTPQFSAECPDPACLCGNDAFIMAVRNCAGACGAWESSVTGHMTDVFCPAGSFTPPSEDPQPTTTEGVPESSPPVESEGESTPTEEPAVEPTSTLAETTTAEPTPTDAVPTDSTTSSPLPSEEVTSGPSVPSTTSSSGTAPTSSSSVDQDQSQDEKEDEDSAEAGGLSQGAAVGIGVGVGVAAIAAIVVAIVLFLRRRRQTKPSSRVKEISRPLPDERDHDMTDRGPYGEKQGAEAESFEMQSNRYEDMLPRQTPRTMV